MASRSGLGQWKGEAEWRNPDQSCQPVTRKIAVLIRPLTTQVAGKTEAPVSKRLGWCVSANPNNKSRFPSHGSAVGPFVTMWSGRGRWLKHFSFPGVVAQAFGESRRFPNGRGRASRSWGRILKCPGEILERFAKDLRPGFIVAATKFHDVAAGRGSGGPEFAPSSFMCVRRRGERVRERTRPFQFNFQKRIECFRIRQAGPTGGAGRCAWSLCVNTGAKLWSRDWTAYVDLLLPESTSDIGSTAVGAITIWCTPTGPD